MSVGRAVRTRLGRLEVPVSDFYRRRFVDLDSCARLLAGAVEARSILEIGCGDGQLAGPLLKRFADARYTGIDVAPEVGRLYRGDPQRASFRTIDSRAFLEEEHAPFDLVVLVDVLHHVPPELRPRVLADARSLTAVGGSYAVKDWTRSRSPWHYAAWASDRFLTGDRVRYFDEDELLGLVPGLHPDDRLVLSAYVPPRANNRLLVYRRS
jgi:2-polyprenyl-6-hydroxyphenyl methylase/3-demethylubiquinone-9 3-methyltransferase